MSVSNPERVVTKQDLKDFYDNIRPYMGGSAAAGFTPVGTVISVMGVNAPANYLKCDGTVYNIADYPELANHFLNEFGSKNFFGGNGTTTFAVPDLRGEFLRGTGTNGHEGSGNGENVGVHQDATNIPSGNFNETNLSFNVKTNENTEFIKNSDGSLETRGWAFRYNTDTSQSAASTANCRRTVRPTNTSVLFCIATKNIYLNPENDYSTDEKVVGVWIDGKTLYQRTIKIEGSWTVSSTFFSTSIANISSWNIDTVVDYRPMIVWGSNGYVPLPFVAQYGDASDVEICCDLTYWQSSNSLNLRGWRATGNTTVTNPIVTIRYTKTT